MGKANEIKFKNGILGFEHIKTWKMMEIEPGALYTLTGENVHDKEPVQFTLIKSTACNHKTPNRHENNYFILNGKDSTVNTKSPITINGQSGFQEVSSSGNVRAALDSLGPQPES